MADRVQFILDRMAPVFGDMEALDVFEKAEVRSIVRSITDFEYVLRRRQQVVGDCNKYLMYVLNLEDLLSLRCSKLAQNATKEKKEQYRKLQSMFMRHICYVFERSLRRFSGNMELWNDYVFFLKSKGASNILNTVFGRAISLHPKSEDLWLQAAVFELEVNCNIHSARVLLQRSLRFNRSSEKLWLRYFQLELWSSTRLMERQGVLGIGKDVPNVSFEGLAVALVVYRHAVAAIPSLEFAYLLLECCGIPNDNAVSRLCKIVEEDIREKHGSTSDYWILDCKRQVAAVLECVKIDGTEFSASIGAICRCVDLSVELFTRGVGTSVNVSSFAGAFLAILADVLDTALETVGATLIISPSTIVASSDHQVNELIATVSKAESFIKKIDLDFKINEQFASCDGNWVLLAHKLWVLRCVLGIAYGTASHQLHFDLAEVCKWLDTNNVQDRRHVFECENKWIKVALMAWQSAIRIGAYTSQSASDNLTRSLIGSDAAVEQLGDVILNKSHAILEADTFLNASSAGSDLLWNVLTARSLSICSNDSMNPVSDAYDTTRGFLESIISAPICRDDNRVQWAIRYIRLAAQDCDTSFRSAVDFLLNLQSRMPMAFAIVDMSECFKVLLATELSFFRELVQTKPNDCTSLACEMARFMKIAGVVKNKCVSLDRESNDAVAEVKTVCRSYGINC